jgi:phage-related protein
VSDLAEGVVQFGSPLRQLGFSLDESIGLFASFGEAGVNTSTVMAGLRQAVKNFGSGLAEEQLGVANFGDVLRGVRDGTFDLTDAMALFGARAGVDVFKAIQEGRFELEDYLDVIRNGSSTIRDTAASTMDWQESLTLLKNNLLLLLEGPATALMGWVSDVAAGFASLVGVFQSDGISGVIARVQENFASLSPSMQAVAVGAGALAVALLAVGIAAAVSALGFLAIPLAIAAVAAGLVYAYQRFEGFRQVVDSVVAWITGTAVPAIVAFAGFVREAFSNVDWAGVWQTIVNAVTTAFTTIQTVVSTVIAVVQGLWSVFGDTIVSSATAAWGLISGVIQTAVDLILGIWTVFAGVFTGDWSAVWEGLGAIVTAVWDAMILMVETAWLALGTAVQLGLDALGALWDAGWEAVKSVLEAAWEAIQSAVEAGIDAVVDFLTALPGRATTAVSDIVSGLTTKGREAMQGMFNALKNVWDTVSGWLGNTGQRAISAVGNLANTLYDKGAAIIQGLWDGMQSVWDSVSGWISDIAGQIGDFFSGLNPFESASLDVNTTTTTAGPALSAFPVEAVSSRYSGQHTQPRIVVEAAGVDTALVEWLRRSVRVESGGNVQAYLGA